MYNNENMPPNPIVIIAGAGPAGTLTAKHLGERGWQATVLEEHGSIGKPVQCAGLISKSGSLANSLPLDGCILNEIQGARIFSPNGEKIELQRFETVAFVIDRQRFDENCAREAEKQGAEILANTRLIGAKEDRVFIQREERGEMLRAKVLVGADGANSKARSLAGTRLPSTSFINAYQITARGSFDREFVELHLGGFAEGFFAWVIPESKKTARIGIGTTMQKNAKKCLGEFLEKKGLDARETGRTAGIIPCSPPIKEPFSGNTLLVGDAAMQAKATTGGGIVTGSMAAKACAGAIDSHLREKKSLGEYADMLAHLNRELSIHWKIRSYLNSLSEQKTNALFARLKKAGIERFLEKHGNMDRPTLFAGKFMANPRNWLLFPELLKVLR